MVLLHIWDIPVSRTQLVAETEVRLYFFRVNVIVTSGVVQESIMRFDEILFQGSGQVEAVKRAMDLNDAV